MEEISQTELFPNQTPSPEAYIPCEECQKIFDHFYSVDEWYNYRPEGSQGLAHRSFESLVASASSGCHVCFLFLSSLSLEDQRSIQSSTTGAKSKIFSLNESWHDLNSADLEMSFPGSKENAEIAIYKTSPHDKSPRAGEVSHTTDCPANWTLIRNWLNNCLSTHTTICGESIVSYSLPTRLVYVGTSESDIQLRLSEDLAPETRYLTLSHCWGLNKFETLTTENLDGMLRQIDVKFLTKTFREAVDITRKLGYHYIWIDSLCIVQDSTDDWQRESLKMSQVYCNTSLNIAAISAEDGSVGCYFDRPSKPLACRVLAVTDGESDATRYLDCMSVDERERPLVEVSPAYSKAPLQDRGWVVQEVSLAPRTLYFGDRQLHWECREQRACESFPVSFRDRFGTAAAEIALINCEENIENITRWFELVSGFSECQLTCSNDKLMAISGLARIFASKAGLQNEYLAGLWRLELERQLCWYIWRGVTGQRSFNYRAPSWSWASVDGRIANTSTRGDCFYSRVESAMTIPALGDSFGLIKDGHLIMLCGCAAYGRMASQEEQEDFVGNIYIGEQEIELGTVYPNTTIAGSDLLFVPVISNETSAHLEEKDKELWGIVLQVSDSKRQVFTRVAAFCVFGGLEFIVAFQDACKVSRSSQPDKYYGEPTGQVMEDGNVEYRMTIY